MRPGTRNRPRGAASDNSTSDNSTSRQTRHPLKRQDHRRGGETWRVLVAATPDERHLAQLSQLQRELRAHLGDAAARWTNGAGLHLTLRFVGDVTPADAGPLCEATSRACVSARPFQLRLANLGCFPNKREPRVLWAGLNGDLQSLPALQSNVAGETADFGKPPEHRPYQPHFTLAHINDGRRVTHIVEHALNQMQDDVTQRDTQHQEA